MTTGAPDSRRRMRSGGDRAVRPAGALLVGPSGSGKTWIQHRLIEDHGFWSPLHITTRPVSDHDPTTVHMAFPTFLEKIESGDLVGPLLFGGSWHAWRPSDFDRLRHGNDRAVVICRPYEALLFNAFEPRLLPLWLSTPAALAAERVRQRNEARDLDTAYLRERNADDAEDNAYSPMFRNVISPGDGAIGDILRRLGYD